MTGEQVPYHLRPNKYVERELFCETLEMLKAKFPLNTYLYASMGGKFLTDHYLINERLTPSALVSIEKESYLHLRQEFNKNPDSIDCKNISSSEFIESFERIMESHAATNAIVWLDFTEAKSRNAQLTEFNNLIAKMMHGDIIKITINASARTFGDQTRTGEDKIESMLADISDKLSRFNIPADLLSNENMNNRGIAKILAACIRHAALEGNSDTGDIIIHPVAIYRYNDMLHQMLTCTCVVLNKSDANQIIDECGLTNFNFYSQSWDDIKEIKVPDFSIKERRFIDHKIDAEGKNLDQIHSELSFNFDKDEVASKEILGSYIEHFTRYPSFVILRTPNVELPPGTDYITL